MITKVFNYLKVLNYRKKVDQLCKAYNIQLCKPLRCDDLLVFMEIFIEKQYSLLFPFYQNSVVVDLGAHKGYFSIFAALNLKPESKILALEPAIENFSVLRTNLEKNRIKSVVPIHSAIAAEKKQMPIYRGFSTNFSLIDSYNMLFGRLPEVCQMVDATTLECFMETNKIGGIDFLKIDIEGSEYSVLFNCPASVLSRIQTISMEYHDLKNEEFTGLTMYKFLKANGFHIVNLTSEKAESNINSGKMVATRW